MATNEQQPLDITGEGLAMLLHGKECPVGYKCLDLDCLECLEIYIDRGGENNGKDDRPKCSD